MRFYLYTYTDAQVFTKMRSLHEELDKKEKDGLANEKESYINDCIKTIMDGQIPEPVFPTCQRLIDLNSDVVSKDKVQAESNKISRKIARRLGIYPERIKANVVEQELMKYKKRIEGQEGATEIESNREAVRIIYDKSGGGDEIKFAAQSNATILFNLNDRALLIFNVYYVAPKSESLKIVDANRNAIKNAFRQFVTEKFQN